MEVYNWIDKHPHATQEDIVKFFQTWAEGALFFDQGTLSRNLKKCSKREAEVTENLAALSSKHARIVTWPDVDQVLWKCVQDRMSNSRTVSGPELSEKWKIFEDKFAVPEAEQLSGAGWQQAFYRRSFIFSDFIVSYTWLTWVADMGWRRYGLKGLKQHGEAASADPKTVEEERARQQEILARYHLWDHFNWDEAGLCGSNTQDHGMATMKLSRTKKSKDRIMILFGCNADGSEKLPLFFIGKSECLQCFRKKMGRELSFNYKSNKKA
jgi:hypothetical protein